MTFKQHQLLSLKLGQCLATLKDFHNDHTHPYWSSLNDIMDDCYRLQDRVNEDYRELEWVKNEI